MEQALIEGLNSKIETLISMYEACKAENQRLEATLESYQDKLLARNTTIEELKHLEDELNLLNENVEAIQYKSFDMSIEEFKEKYENYS